VTPITTRRGRARLGAAWRGGARQGKAGHDTKGKITKMIAINQKEISADDIDRYAAWLCERPVYDVLSLISAAKRNRPDLQISAMRIRSMIEDQIGEAAELIVESGVWRYET
jgi:hypothetical protein